MRFRDYMLSLLPGHTPDHLKGQTEILVFREKILQAIWVIVSLISILSLGIAFTAGFTSRSLYLLLAITEGVSLFFSFRRNLPFPLRAIPLLIIFFIISAYMLINGRVSNFGLIFMLVVIIYAALLMGPKTAFFTALLSAISIPVITVGIRNGIIPTVGAEPDLLFQANRWYLAVIFLIVAASFTTPVISTLITNLQTALLLNLKNKKNLLEEKQELEDVLVERTNELENQNLQFKVISQLARDISILNDVNHLLNDAVHIIVDRFALYHAGIYILDPAREFAVLRAANGETGQKMLESDYRVKIGETSLVGYVARHGEEWNSPNIDEDPLYEKNSSLPLTRSELSLPLKIGDQTLGVLDLQSTHDYAFKQSDIHFFQTIASQLAVAVDKARISGRLDESVKELETSYQQFTQKSWRSYLRARKKRFAYHYKHSHISTDTPETSEMIEVIASEHPVITNKEDIQTGRPLTAITIPIRLRNQVVGVLDVHFDSQTIPSDMQALLETITNRLALALENARLLEEIQNRAERERMVGEISAKVRSSTDVSGVLRTAAQELGRSLGVSEVIVQLRSDE